MKVGEGRERADAFQKRRERSNRRKRWTKASSLSQPFSIREPNRVSNDSSSPPFQLLCRFLPLIRPVSTRDTIRPTFPLDPLFSPSPPYLPIPSSFPFFHRSKTMVPRMRDRGSIVSDGFQGVVGRMRRAVKVARKDRAMKSITERSLRASLDRRSLEWK